MSDTPDSRLPALERLAISRERIRQSLAQDIAEDSHPAGPGGSALFGALLAIPGAKVVVEAVQHWWSQHPLHLATLVAGSAARRMVRPMARRNPYALIFAAMLAGGVFVWLKPWRGLLKPALLAGLLPQLVSRAVHHVPVESWLSALFAIVSGRHRDEATESEAAPAANQPPAQAANASGTAMPPSSSTLH